MPSTRRALIISVSVMAFIRCCLFCVAAICLSYQWISISISGYPYPSVDIQIHPWISVDIHIHQWISMDIRIHQWISVDIHIYLFMDSCGYPNPSVDICGYPYPSVDIRGVCFLNLTKRKEIKINCLFKSLHILNEYLLSALFCFNISSVMRCMQFIMTSVVVMYKDKA